MIRRKKKTKAKKPKLPSITKLMKEADRLFSIQVRSKGAWMQDGELWNRSYTSPEYTAPIKKLHCGHYLSRFYKAARWNFDNARPQSMMDNMWKKGDLIIFRRNLISEIGEARVHAVEALRDAPIKLSREFLEAKIQELKAQV